MTLDTVTIVATDFQNNGRRPEFVGTDVTVFDIMDGLRYRLFPSIIGQLLDVREADVNVAIQYIADHRDELETEYERVREARAVDFPRLSQKLEAIRNDYRKEWEKWHLPGTPSHGFPPWSDFDRPFIFDRGRGPEIVGSRITVYSVMDYWKYHWPAPAIAWWLRLTTGQVEVAIEYIESNRAEVERNYQVILERCARGNPPHIQAKLDALKGSAAAARERLRQGKPLRETGFAEPSGRP